MNIVGFHVDAKGRIALPKAARDLARVQPNSRLVGRVEEGRIILETAETVQDRVWAKAAAAVVPGRPVADLAQIEHETLASRERGVGGPGTDDVGEELLAELGL
ncbi:MAG: AbrB/MazE/SpoVT family DNA-binding domain-containing protein [Actinomycetota bacterium]|nr:AbrB/MazE/SpoVT family DNA-binding domain-containing protein [Actinomycetota bacterium]